VGAQSNNERGALDYEAIFKQLIKSDQTVYGPEVGAVIWPSTWMGSVLRAIENDIYLRQQDK